MPWLSIIMAIVTFLLSLKKDKSNIGQAAVIGAAAGLGTYYVSHETDWGKENLLQYDGGVDPSEIEATTNNIANTETPDADGTPSSKVPSVRAPSTGSTAGATGSIWRPIKNNMLPIAGGAVIGATAASADIPKWVPLVAGGVLIYLILRK